MTIHRRARHPSTLTRILAGTVVAVIAAGWAALAWPHHAAQATYFTDQIIEVEGRVTSLLWRNPHVRFTLAVDEPDGGTTTWNVESIPVTRLTRVGVSADVIGVGETVTVAGYPPRRPGNNVYAINLLLADNREVLLDTPTPRWTDNTLGTGLDNSPGTPSADPSLGLFRVWSTDGISLGDRNPALPFTAAARAASEGWDSLSPDNPFRGCTPKGMPSIMNQPNPMAFEDLGDRIIFRLEEFDTVREIIMAPELAADVAPSPLGRSIGRWEDQSLVIETDRIAWPYFDQRGHLQSEAIELVERFTPSSDGARLEYALTITDPALFEAPVTLVKTWIWVPGAQVLPFECTED